MEKYGVALQSSSLKWESYFIVSGSIFLRIQESFRKMGAFFAFPTVAISKNFPFSQIILRLNFVPDQEEKCLTCFCHDASDPSSGARFTRGAARASSDEDSNPIVRCGSLPFPAGGRFGCGVLLSPDRKMLSRRRDLLPSAEVTVTAPGPKVTSVRVARSGDIVIEFDQKVVSATGRCENIFDTATVNLLGDGATCAVRGSRLRVSEASNAEPATVLKFAGDADLFSGSVSDPDFAAAVSPEETVKLPDETTGGGSGKGGGRRKGKSEDGPSVILHGDSNVCFGSPGRFRVDAHRDLEKGDIVRWEVRKAVDRDSREEEEGEELGELVLSGAEVIGGGEEEEEDVADDSAADESHRGRKKKKGSKKKGRTGKAKGGRGGGGRERRTVVTFETETVNGPLDGSCTR